MFQEYDFGVLNSKLFIAFMIYAWGFFMYIQTDKTCASICLEIAAICQFLRI